MNAQTQYVAIFDETTRRRAQIALRFLAQAKVLLENETDTPKPAAKAEDKGGKKAKEPATEPAETVPRCVGLLSVEFLHATIPGTAPAHIGALHRLAATLGLTRHDLVEPVTVEEIAFLFEGPSA